MKEKKSRIVICEKIPLKVENQHLGLITLSRPQEMNPLNWPMLKELQAVLESLSTDKSIRVIAITGAGKAFQAGLFPNPELGYLYRDTVLFIHSKWCHR